MQKRKLARKRAKEVNLPELLDRLELALTRTPPRTSVCRALSDQSRRLCSSSGKAAAQPGRSASSRRRRQTAVESLQLFS
jgi:hypothetical protein